MAVRDFRDEHGREWRAWDVNPDQLHPATRYELPGEYQGGWLAFETKDGAVRKRLAIYPTDWSTLPTEELERLVMEAEPVPKHRPRRAEGPEPPDPARRAEDEAAP
jgi:hypothetical protein